MDEPVAGFSVPVHRALTSAARGGDPQRDPGRSAGAWTAAWIAGLLLWAVGHAASVWAAKRDPLFVDVVRRHLRIPAHLTL